MRIAFVGKGGSGKTTLASLFCRALATSGERVLAIDADVNQHLREALGAAKRDGPHALGDQILFIKNYLRGTNARIISSEQMLKTTPPGKGSRMLRLSESNPIFDRCADHTPDGIRLMNVGCFQEDDLGVKCYHSKTGAVELILNHLTDGPGEYIVVDMTAGVDAFASGLFNAFDVTLLAVEPTRKSTSVYTQYRTYAEKFDIDLRLIANKITDHADETFIREHTDTEPIASFHTSSFVRTLDRGEFLPLPQLESENRAELARLIVAINRIVPDREAQYQRAVEIHRRNAVAWGNDLAGEDLERQIDPDFHPITTFS